MDIQRQIAVDLAYFFSPLSYRETAGLLGLPKTKAIQPLSMLDFFKWAKLSKGNGLDYEPLRQHVFSIVWKMRMAGFLSHEGNSGKGVMGNGDHYYSAHERSSGALRGLLFLGKALGSAYIGHEISKSLVAIEGTTPEGDAAVGTGVHVHPEYLVTCAHVVNDMQVDSSLVVNGTEVTVVNVASAKGGKLDVGVVRFTPPVPLGNRDLMFRDAAVLEQVVIAGYPTVPTALDRFLSFQSGEICQIGVSSYHGFAVDLFSAIARPGNSGGPVISMEGNIVGIVTQSLEREKEAADVLKPLPFFASVPASDVRDVFKELTGEDLPWEHYE